MNAMSTEPDEPFDVATAPPELQEALRRMSARGEGPVVDLATGQVVAEGGRLVTDEERPANAPVPPSVRILGAAGS